MPWNTPSAAEALVSPQEKSSLSTIAGAADQLQSILDRETAAARGAIIAGGGRLGPEGTLPDQVIPDVLALVAWRYLGGYPALKTLQTDQRKQLYEDARAAIRETSQGKTKVELPADGTALNAAGPVGQIQVASKTHRHFTRGKLRGL